jgi:phospholipid/cholesterol/gamma-HCH transport system ATP-binding protein
MPPSRSPSRSSASEAVAIRLEGVVNAFGRHVVHDRLELEVRRGEILGLVGGSGTGKSVLLRTIVGLRRPQAGRVMVLGQDLFRLGAGARRRLQARWGVLFQDGALFSSLTVRENVQVPLRERLRLAPALLDELAAVKLGLVGLGPDAADKLPAELSGGMRKRAGLARAIAMDPEIILLDEPTAGLDPIGAAAFDELILALKDALGLTVVMITHDVDSLVRITDRVAVLLNKRCIVATLDELRRRDEPWLRAYLGGPRGRAALDAGGKGS